MARVVVIGVGNPLLGDEGVGVTAVERLREQGVPEEVEIVDAGTDSLDALLDATDAERVIIVDAVDAGGEAGTLYRFDAAKLMEAETLRPLLSLHQMTLKESVALAELSGFDRRRLVVVGVQPALVGPRMGLSDAVAERFDALLDMIRDEIRRVGRDKDREEDE